MGLSKNIPYWKVRTDSVLNLMDGHLMDIQETKDLITVQWELMSTLEEQSLTHITGAVYIQVSIFQEQMLK